MRSLVFCHPHTGNPYDASKLRKRFYAAMTAAAMRARCGRSGGITFHSLRHTFGTRMAAVGAPMRTLQEWMGHRDHTTTLIYADFAPDPTGGAAFAERAFGRAEPAVDGAPSPMMETSVTADMRLRASQVRRSPGNDVVRPSMIVPSSRNSVGTL